MSFKSTTGKSIQEAFEEFNAKNPEIMQTFKQLVELAVHKKNKTKLSSKMIINAIRWNLYLETDDDVKVPDQRGAEPKSFKINDAYTSHYARKFVQQYPQYKTYFNFKELRA